MFFNYDLFEIVSIAFVISGILTYSFYNSSGTINNSKSLVNTLSNSDVSDNLNKTQFIDASVQTEAPIQVEASVQALNTYVNTGMQTSARMWLESIRNWITEILGTNPNPNPQYVDVGVQTNATSLWCTVKQWFLDVCSVRSSELSSIGYNKVKKWIDKLDPSAANSTVESCNTVSSVSSQSSLQELVNPNDSASNVSEIISESNLDNRVYDVTDPEYLSLLINDDTVDFKIIDNIHFAVSDNMLLSIDPSFYTLLV